VADQGGFGRQRDDAGIWQPVEPGRTPAEVLDPRPHPGDAATVEVVVAQDEVDWQTEPGVDLELLYREGAASGTDGSSMISGQPARAWSDPGRRSR
jgi:hypothetical protein